MPQPKADPCAPGGWTWCEVVIKCRIGGPPGARDVGTVFLTSQIGGHKSIYTMARSSPRDPKLEALRASGCLNRRPERVTDAVFTDSEFFDARDLVQVKYEMLRRVSIDGTPVVTSADAFGFSRPSFYQAQAAFESAGIHGLVPAKPGPRRAHKLSEEVVDFIEKELAAGAKRAPAELARLVKERFGRQVHARSIERALARREKKRRARTR
jgi:transposase